MRKHWYLGSLVGLLVVGATGCSSQSDGGTTLSNLTNSSQTSQMSGQMSSQMSGQMSDSSQTDTQKAAQQLGPQGFSQIHMVNAKDGWAIYTHLPYQWVLKTTDGGAHWMNVTPEGSTTRGGIEGQFLNADEAVTEVLPYELQQDVVLNVTQNGGTWQPSVMPGALMSGEHVFAAQSPEALWALMNNYLWKSTDGGANWSKTGSKFGSQSKGSLPQLAGDNGVLFTTKNQGWISGLNEQFGQPFLYHTTNGGVSWVSQKLALPATASQDQITTDVPHFVSQTTGFLPVFLMHGSTHLLELFTTSDGGQTWQGSTSIHVGSEIKAPIYVGTSGVWALKQQIQGSTSATQTVLYRTTAGANWQVVAKNPFGSHSGQVTEIDFPTSTEGFAILMTNQGSQLLHTTNGGQTWSVIPASIS